MDGFALQAARGHRLAPAGDPYGVFCDQDGPSLGPIKLLERTRDGFAPPPAEKLNLALSRAFGRPLDASDMLPGLHAAARAMNRGDLVRAMIITQLLKLPVLSREEAERAARAVALAKAAPDDPEHPGWPAGTPGGVGGEFRPKNGASGEEARKAIASRLRRRIARRAVRAALKRILSARRAARLGADAASNAVPGLDIVGDAAAAVDISQAIAEASKLKTEIEAALDFVNKGPHSLEELQVSATDESFPSFDAFKKEDLLKRFGPAGPGYEYHHIVEQAGNGISASELQSTRNIIRIPTLLHQEVTAEFSSVESGAPGSLRTELEGKGFEQRWQAGLGVLRRIGILD